ncbi:hypothetical protein [Nocardia brasiliensis]|uniref:hypothetical protein n=1 Tax=Nocardia brasiliensis TaxID=37326 RepID=UPI00366F1824
MIGAGTPRAAAYFRRVSNTRVPVLADPTLTVYRRLGLRQSSLASTTPRSSGDGWAASTLESLSQTRITPDNSAARSSSTPRAQSSPNIDRSAPAKSPTLPISTGTWLSPEHDPKAPDTQRFWTAGRRGHRVSGWCSRRWRRSSGR